MVLLRGKVVVVGAAGVGKSSLCQVFASNGAVVPKNYQITTGAELHDPPRVVTVNDKDSDGTDDHTGKDADGVELHLFDVGGHHIYRQLAQEYLPNTSLGMLVYDVTNPDSFDAVEKWLKLFQTKLGRMPPVVIVANKVDLIATPNPRGAKFAQDFDIPFFEVSALKNDNVDAPFVHLATKLHACYKARLEKLKLM